MSIAVSAARIGRSSTFQPKYRPFNVIKCRARFMTTPSRFSDDSVIIVERCISYAARLSCYAGHAHQLAIVGAEYFWTGNSSKCLSAQPYLGIDALVQIWPVRREQLLRRESIKRISQSL